MSMRRPDPQLQRAWRSKPPRSQRVVQGALAVVASVAVAAAGALLVRSCNGDGDEPAPPVLPPLSSTTTTSTTTTTTTVAVVRTYEIQSGDSLFAIAQRFGVTVAALLEVNGIEDPDRIEAGQILTLPPNASLTPITTTTTTTTVDDDAPVETTLAP